MRPDEDQPYSLHLTDESPSEAVFTAIGAASACWDNLSGAGVFHSDNAKQIGEELLAYLGFTDTSEEDTIVAEGDRVTLLLNAGANGLWVSGQLGALFSGAGDTDGLLQVTLDGDTRPTNIYERQIVMIRREVVVDETGEVRPPLAGDPV